jgi:hypothetical protein
MKMIVPSINEKIAKRNWFDSLCARIEAIEARQDPFFPLLFALVLYALVVLALAHRPLWHDELYTYYIAKASTLRRLFSEVIEIELQPPLQYVLTWLSLRLFGDSDLVTRVPSLLGFTVASLCLYLFVRRRLGRFYGLTAVLILWATLFLRYAAEARPYALMLGFLGVAMVGWQDAIQGRRRRLGFVVLALGVCGMLLSHAFSPLLVAFLGVAELVRSLDRRKVDWPVWAAFALPAPTILLYVRMFRRFEGWTFLPFEFQASPFKIVSFYVDLWTGVSGVLFAAFIAALIAYRFSKTRTESNPSSLLRHEIALAIGLLSLPIPINVFLMRSGGAFWPRYCIAAGFGLSLLLVHVLSKLTNGNRVSAAIAAFCIFLLMVFSIALQIAHPPERAIVKTLSLTQLDSRLPLVTASGLTFLEMNKREDGALLPRVFYLTDRDAAIRYAHATIFEGTERLRQYFPIRGTVTPYRDFVRRSPHFFVLGTPDYSEDWLIPKLLDDGAELQFIGELRSAYKDRMLFEVKLPGPPSR